ncbi:hypothetical protein D3C73_651370 [compost metagenome]
MTETRIEELATDETRKAFPRLERDDQVRFMAVVRAATKTIVDDYAIEDFREDETVRELIAIDLKNMFES